MTETTPINQRSCASDGDRRTIDTNNTAAAANDLNCPENRQHRVLEFYSGLGGWSCALRGSTDGHRCTVVGAHDVNTLANDVYRHNHGLAPSGRSISNLSRQTLDKYAADVWLMSPPCQPFTRNNTTACRDDVDPRTNSFMHLVALLPALEAPPRLLALENVVGFESSACCAQWLQTLASLNYEVEQFHWSPSQLGIPNARPRYYCIAWRNEQESDQKVQKGQERQEVSSDKCRAVTTELGQCSDIVQPLADFLEVLSDNELVSPMSFVFICCF
jgi:tRNA (cytosine38-C5)-methyltransferase